MSELTASAPSVTVEAGVHLARITPDATRQKHSVEISGLLRIELVDPFGEQGAELLALGFIDGRNDLGFHDALGYWKEPSRRLRNPTTSRRIFVASPRGVRCRGRAAFRLQSP